MTPVAIVGGGWAGLAAAVELTSHRIPVTVIEAAGQLGGRARTVEVNRYRIDNGQHLMLGAYHDMLRLMHIVGVNEEDVFERLPLELFMTGLRTAPVRISLPRQPAPLHMVSGLYRATGINFSEKMDLVRLCTSLLLRRDTTDRDTSLAQWLEQHRQPDSLRQRLWEPLCLATMNTSLDEASTRLFLRVMRDVFTRQSRDADLLLTRRDLGAVFPEPAGRYVEAHGGTIRMKHRVNALRISEHAISAVSVAHQNVWSDHVILAVPPTTCHRLLAPHPILLPLAETIGAMPEAPICTIYIQYASGTTLSRPLIGLVDTTAQWVFDRARNGQAGLMAVVISGTGNHMDADKKTLAETVIREMAMLFPHWPPPVDWHVIREKHATFVARPEVNAMRPANRTPVRGLWLAGDYTATGYPATLEGAIRSGIAAARGVMQESGAA